MKILIIYRPNLAKSQIFFWTIQQNVDAMFVSIECESFGIRKSRLILMVHRIQTNGFLNDTCLRKTVFFITNSFQNIPYQITMCIPYHNHSCWKFSEFYYIDAVLYIGRLSDQNQSFAIAWLANVFKSMPIFHAFRALDYPWHVYDITNRLISMRLFFLNRSERERIVNFRLLLMHVPVDRFGWHRSC